MLDPKLLSKINSYPKKVDKPNFTNSYADTIVKFIGEKYELGWAKYFIYSKEIIFIDNENYSDDPKINKALMMLPNNNVILYKINEDYGFKNSGTKDPIDPNFEKQIEMVFKEKLTEYLKIIVKVIIENAEKAEKIAKEYLIKNKNKITEPTIAEDLNGIDFFCNNKIFQVKNTNLIEKDENVFEIVGKVEFNNVSDYLIIIDRNFEILYFFDKRRIKILNKTITSQKGTYRKIMLK